MADEPKTTPKKPPAHEVILEMLTHLAGEWRRYAHGYSWSVEGRRQYQMVCGALVGVLGSMYLPEKVRETVLQKLHALEDADCIREAIDVNGFNVYSRAIVDLSAPTHAANAARA